MKKKQLIINIISNVLALGIQLGINFILTPIIVDKVGNAAYGFIGLANNFVSYASILTIAINSMASRFITMELSKGNIENANKYYSSVFIMDILLSIIIAVASIIMIANLNSLLEIPVELEKDVQLTFILAFANFIISLLSTIFTIATFAKNRLDIEAIKNIVANILKAIALIVLFSLLIPKVYYISLAAVIYTIFTFITSIFITKKIAPELKVSRKNYSKQYVITVIKSGIWNSINNLSRILLTGLDLLIANLFVGADAMGILSIAKTIPTTIENFLGTIANVFTPNFIYLYSKNKIRELIKEVKFSIKIIALIMIVPMAGFIVFGHDFFTLWLNGKSIEEINQIQILSILSLLPYVLSCNEFTLYLLDTVTNKLKRPVVFTFIMSILSTISTIVLLKNTNLGIYAVASVSSIYWCIKMIIFTPINAAKNLRVKWYTFFPIFIKLTISFLLIMSSFMIIENFLCLNSWKNFIIYIGLIGSLGYILSFLIILDKNEKNKLFAIVKNRIKRKNI